MVDSSVKNLHGIWRVIPSISLTEIIAQSGFNFQILDCEHGPYDFKTLQEDITACHLEKNLAFVRVSGLNKVEVQRCLDLGANGIVFPQLNGYTDFLQATKMLKYAPEGVRGFNPFVRSASYGVNNGVNSNKINCIAIVETLQAVDELDDILTLDDLDIIYIGSYDLSAQLDCLGQMDSPKLKEVVDKIIQKCNAVSKRVGIMINSVEQYSEYKTKGVNVFVHTIDSHQTKKMFTSIINLNK